MINLLSGLPSNISDNFNYVLSDFTGISFNFSGILLVIINFIFAIGLIIVFYLIGEKINRFITKNPDTETKNIFVNIALGYILFGTIIALLGLLSLLYIPILYVYYLLTIAFAIYPINTLKPRLLLLNNIYKHLAYLTKINKWIIFATFLFVFIALLRLIIPDTAEDAVGYHTSQPKMYLANHTTMLESKEIMQIMYYPQLPEMLYLTSFSLGINDSGKYIHFMFYVLVLLLIFSLIKQKKDFFIALVPLFFVTSSVIIRVTSSVNADFQWVFCALTTFLLLQETKLDYKKTILSGLIFGGILASKLWVLVYIPGFILYLTIKHWKYNKNYLLKFVFLFLFFAFASVFVWQFRSFIWTGNPFYPLLDTNRIKSIEDYESYASWTNYFAVNIKLFEIKNLAVFSPLFFLGIGFFLLKPFRFFKEIKAYPFFFLAVIISIEHLFLNIWVPRYNLFLFLLISFFSSLALYYFYKYTFTKILIFSGFSILFFYYFINTLLILPYGFNWAEQNKYLTRVLTRDNSTYYDFDHKFNKYISKNDIVATYNIFGYYYADFSYIDIEYVFDEKNRNFDNLKNKGATKLFINGGDVEWFCKRKKITGCDLGKTELLSKYTDAQKPRYLYSIK